MTNLSAAALAVIVSVELDSGERLTWFPVLCREGRSPAFDETWDLAEAELTEYAADAGVATATVERAREVLAAELDPVAVLRELHEAGPDEADRAYTEATAEEEPAEAEEPGDTEEQEPGDAGTAEEELPDASEFPRVALGDEGEWVEYADALLTRAGF